MLQKIRQWEKIHTRVLRVITLDISYSSNGLSDESPGFS